MTGPLEQKLEAVARRVGWRLRWKSEPLTAFPAQTCTELDIFEGKRLVTANGPVCIIHAGKTPLEERTAGARERIADMVLAALPRRGAGRS